VKWVLLRWSQGSGDAVGWIGRDDRLAISAADGDSMRGLNTAAEHADAVGVNSWVDIRRTVWCGAAVVLVKCNVLSGWPRHGSSENTYNIKGKVLSVRGSSSLQINHLQLGQCRGALVQRDGGSSCDGCGLIRTAMRQM
jgi:hypothetical protein